MDVNVVITASPELLSRIDAIVSLCGSFAYAEKPTKPAKKRKSETDTAPEPTPTAEAPVDSSKQPEPAHVPKAEEPEPEPEPDGQNITVEEVRARTAEKSMNGKREQAKALLAEFQVTNISALNPSDYPAFLKKLAGL